MSSFEDESTDNNSTVDFATALTNQISKDDVVSMVQLQREMLSRYEKTNEMLINFNMLSLSRYATTCQEFKKHTHLLYEMKRDLEAIFKRIRSMKQRLGRLYPEAFSACSDVYNVLNSDEETHEEATSVPALSPLPPPHITVTSHAHQATDRQATTPRPHEASRTVLNSFQHSGTKSKDVPKINGDCRTTDISQSQISKESVNFAAGTSTDLSNSNKDTSKNSYVNDVHILNSSSDKNAHPVSSEINKG